MKQIRDYSLIGKESKKVIDLGLTDAQWYTSPIPKVKMKQLLERKNTPAIIDTLIWFGLIIGFAYLTVILWGNWYAFVPYLLYAVLYASTSDSRWHESSHGTAFKSDWMNNTLYEVASFMVFRQSTVWRYSHTRHHSDTLVRGRDPEISVKRPPIIPAILSNFFGINSGIAELKRILIHASGKIDKEVATYLPETEYSTVIIKARIYLFIYLTTIAASFYWSTPLPALFILAPSFAGSWLMPIYGLTQHAGLEENVLDHRLNCRTVYMNRIHRFLYWNMNYHIEHHMFPLVPYHALPKLHELMKDDCPPPYHGIINTFKEIIPAVLRQVKDPSYFVKRELPENAGKVSEENHLKLSISDADSLGWLKIFEADKIDENEIVRIDINESTVAIYRLENNQFYASEGMCTHGNAHLADGVIIGNQIECSKHNGRFKIEDGTVQRQPVCVDLTTYLTKVEDGMLCLNLNNLDETKETYRTFKVKQNKNVATFIKELVLVPSDGKPFKFTPGDYIHLKIPKYQTTFSQFDIDEPYTSEWDKQNLFNCFASNHKMDKRNYSLATNPNSKSELKFNVRIALPPTNETKAGIGSSYVFGLKEGDEVEVAGPYGDFHIKDSENEMVYIGGGAGMAPLRSHISNLFETQNTKRKVSFWYGARSKQELFYEDYFANLATKNESFQFNIGLSNPSPEENWDGYKGFIHSVVDEYYLKQHEHIHTIEFYLCGPPAMITACKEMLKSYNVSDDNILYDEF